MSLKKESPEEFWQFYYNKPSNYHQCVNQNIVFSTQRYWGGGHCSISSLQNISNKLYQDYKDDKYYVKIGGTLPIKHLRSPDHENIHSHKRRHKTGRKTWNKIIKSFSLRKPDSHHAVYFEVVFALAPNIILFSHIYILYEEGAFAFSIHHSGL